MEEKEKNYKGKPFMKKKTYNDTNLFVSGVILLKEMMKITKNMEKDDKIVFGHDLVRLFKKVVINFSLSYKSCYEGEKKKYGGLILEALNEADIHLRMIYECGVIGLSRYADLSKRVGDIIMQTKGWCRSLHNNIDNADGVSVVSENQD